MMGRGGRELRKWLVGLPGLEPGDLILIRVLPPSLFPQDRACDLGERPTAGHRRRPLRTARLRWRVDQTWTDRATRRAGRGVPLPGLCRQADPVCWLRQHFPLVCRVVREALTECGTTEFWPPSPISADSSAAGLFSGGCGGRWVWDPSAVRGEMSIICVLSTAPFLVRVARCWLLCGTGRSRRGASGDRSSSSLAVAGAARRSAESTAQFRFSASWNALDTAARARDDW
jgi:hypothetical protein